MDNEYVSYIGHGDDQPTVVEGIERLAAAALAALEGGCEFHWMRARTDIGERQLTRDEQLAVLLAMGRQIDERE